MNKHMQEIFNKTDVELHATLAEKREALRQFRFGMKGSRTRETKLGVALRKDIARILTRMHTREETKV